ncbi:MAG TPA: hydroxymethylglutaryl-CoA lyase, partial [Burkholderiales bacterium]|nr:hydroxymethylglutaryl-CoA lyase [Burkholderiales bacterium]
PKAVQRALADLDAGFGVNEISLLVSATESHTQKNLKRSRAEQWANIEEMVRTAGGRFRMVGTVSVAFGCPFEGKVDPGNVLRDVSRFAALGVDHVAIGDTTGMATPLSVKNLFKRIEGVTTVAHFHDSRGTGLVNCVAAHDAGVRHFDSSFGGVGGHPAKVKYGGGFTGNVCTEDLVSLFESMGIATGIDLDQLLATAKFCEQALGRELHGRVTRSGLNQTR